MSRIKQICHHCGNPFYDYKSSRMKFCSRGCYYKSKIGTKASLATRKKMSESGKRAYRNGKKSYWKGKKIPKSLIEKRIAGKKGNKHWWGHKISKANKGRKFTEEHLRNLSKAHIGQIAWNRGRDCPQLSGESSGIWLGGKSFEPYSPEFNDAFKRKIRKRDNYTCQECGYTEEQLGRKLDIHHIDYDKKNNDLKNLICLCRACHAQTNYSRKDWTNYFLKKGKFL